MISLLGIILSLLLLIYLAYRDVSVLILAPICAMLAVLMDGKLPVLAAYTQIFMGSVGQFIADFFPLFMLGALFGKLMEDSGSAAKIADMIVKAVGVQRTILAIVLSCTVLTYGGVSLFVVVFAVFPLSRSLFREADIPRRLIPATIGLGSFTYTMTALPGSVQIQNQIPTQFFGTTSFAAPGLGIMGSLVIFVLGMLWLNRCAAVAKRNGEGFGPVLPTDEVSKSSQPDASTRSLPSAIAALAPIVCVIALTFVFSQLIIPKWDGSYLSEEQFGKTTLARVTNGWSTILSMVIALILITALHFRSTERLKASLTSGARSALMPVFNTACEYGYGSTIKSLAGFAAVQSLVTGIAPGNPLISEAIAVNALAAITGSASGGLSIALKALGETYLQRGEEAGISPELLHRVASMSCGCLDSLPHNGALITLLLICGVTHRQGYRDVGMVTVLIPLFATAVVVTVGTMFGSF
jgi:H+/gluconate symporter-like permease